MLVDRAVPPGDPVAPEEVYGDLRLEELAGSERPHVIANFVSSADGRATVDGRSGGLGGPADRAAFHLLRSQVDAILAGTGTLRAESYGRLVRDDDLERRRREQGRAEQPLGVVISASGQIPWTIPLFDDDGSRVVVFAPADTEIPQTAAAVTLEAVQDPRELGEVLRRLRTEHGVRSLLCEGGPALLHAIVAAGALDELFLTVAPVLAGGAEAPVAGTAALPAPVDLRLVSALHHDGMLLLRYARR